MANFQNIVMIVATVILIISLLIIGVMIYKDKYKNLFPPVLPGCPQPGWIHSEDGTNCTPIYPIPGSHGGCDTIPFVKTPGEAYRWAETCNIPWDGITGHPDPRKQTSNN